MTHGIRLVIEDALAAVFPQAVLDREPLNGSIFIKDERGDRWAISVRLVQARSVDEITADRLGVTNDPIPVERFLDHLTPSPVVETDLAAIELRVLAGGSPDVRTERILDALFGGTVTGRATFPLPPGCGAQTPKPAPMIGVNEEDYRNGGLPRR